MSDINNARKVFMYVCNAPPEVNIIFRLKILCQFLVHINMSFSSVKTDFLETSCPFRQCGYGKYLSDRRCNTGQWLHSCIHPADAFCISLSFFLRLNILPCTPSSHVCHLCSSSHVRHQFSHPVGLFVFGSTATPPPPLGQGLLIHEVPISHTTTHHSR